MADLLPPTDVTRVDDRRIEYLRIGAGRPAVVFINGAGGPILGWYKVLPDTARQSTVVAFNGAGIGGSDPPSRPQTSEEVVRSIRTLLGGLDVPPPWLVVGHSIGGLHAQWFARRHPDEVAGIVLLEATAPADVRALKAGQPRWQRMLQGLVDRLHARDPFGEVEQAQASADAFVDAPPFPPLPLRVVTGGKPMPRLLMPERLQQIRSRHQAQLAALSPLGRQVIAMRSRHFPQMTEPEVVTGAIGDVLAQCSQRSTP